MERTGPTGRWHNHYRRLNEFLRKEISQKGEKKWKKGGKKRSKKSEMNDQGWWGCGPWRQVATQRLETLFLPHLYLPPYKSSLETLSLEPPVYVTLSFPSSSVLTITPHLRCTTSYPLKGHQFLLLLLLLSLSLSLLHVEPPLHSSDAWASFFFFFFSLSLSLCCVWSHHCIFIFFILTSTAQMHELLSSLKGISFHYCIFPSSPQLHASSLSFPSSL